MFKSLAILEGWQIRRARSGITPESPALKRTMAACGLKLPQWLRGAIPITGCDLAPELGDSVENRLKPRIRAQRSRVSHRVGEFHRVGKPVVLSPQLVIPSELSVRPRRPLRVHPPGPPDLSQHLRIHVPVPERRDRGHVGGPEQSSWPPITARAAARPRAARRHNLQSPAPIARPPPPPCLPGSRRCRRARQPNSCGPPIGVGAVAWRARDATAHRSVTRRAWPPRSGAAPLADRI